MLRYGRRAGCSPGRGPERFFCEVAEASSGVRMHSDSLHNGVGTDGVFGRTRAPWWERERIAFCGGQRGQRFPSLVPRLTDESSVRCGTLNVPGLSILRQICPRR